MEYPVVKSFTINFDYFLLPCVTANAVRSISSATPCKNEKGVHVIIID